MREKKKISVITTIVGFLLVTLLTIVWAWQSGIFINPVNQDPIVHDDEEPINPIDPNQPIDPQDPNIELPKITYIWDNELDLYSSPIYMIKDISELLTYPTSLTEWSENLVLPIYRKKVLNHQEMLIEISKITQQLELSIIECQFFSKDDSINNPHVDLPFSFISCELNEGYLDFNEDGSYGLYIFEESLMINFEVFEQDQISDQIKNAIKGTWLDVLWPMENPTVEPYKILYNFYEQKITYYVYYDKPTDDISLLQSYHYPRIELVIAYDENSIIGINISGLVDELVGYYPILTLEQAIENFTLGKFVSPVVNRFQVSSVEILATELTIEYGLFQKYSVPIINVYVTSTLPYFMDDLDFEGIPIHKISVLAIDEKYLE